MSEKFEPTEIDMAEIERKDRRLRAQATRDMFAAMGTWFRSRFSFGGNRTA
ncbi:MAG: hypothetical protein AAFY80_06200 [Pseudomonadota bacterium]